MFTRWFISLPRISWNTVLVATSTFGSILGLWFLVRIKFSNSINRILCKASKINWCYRTRSPQLCFSKLFNYTSNTLVCGLTRSIRLEINDSVSAFRLNTCFIGIHLETVCWSWVWSESIHSLVAYLGCILRWLALVPVAFVFEGFIMIKLSITMFLVVEELSFIILSVWPIVNTMSRLQVHHVMSSVSLAVIRKIFLPASKSVPQTLLKLPLIIGLVAP